MGFFILWIPCKPGRRNPCALVSGLDGSNEDAFYKITLKKRVDHQHGDQGYENHRILHLLGDHHAAFPGMHRSFHLI